MSENHYRSEVVAIVAVSICFSAAFTYPLFNDLRRAALFDDWSYSLSMAWESWASVRSFHQLPLWNPYKCGGIPLLGNPQSRILTPFFLLHLIIGPIAGAHIEIPIHFAIGCAGGYVLSRMLGTGKLAATAAAVTFTASSWFSLHMTEGHLVLLSMVYLPWVCAFVLMALDRRRLVFAVAAGLVVALTVGEGVHYTAPYTVLLIVILTVNLAIIRRSHWPILVLLVVVAFGSGFAAIKLLPVIDMLREHPRRIDALEYNSVSRLLQAIFARNQDHNQQTIWMWAFHEYGAYISPPLAVLAVLGLAMSFRRALPWAILAVAFFTLAIGDYGPHAPYAYLHLLPGFSSMRIPSRFLIPFVLAMAVLAAIGADALCVRGRITYLLSALMILGGAADCWWVGAGNFKYVLTGPVFSPSPVEVSPHRLLPDMPTPTARPDSTPSANSSIALQNASWKQNNNINWSLMLPLNEANVGATNCYEYTAISTAVRGFNRPGYHGEQYLRGAGIVTLDRWTPNLLRYNVEVPKAATLVINQNFDSGWRLWKGVGNVIGVGGLLAVALPPGGQKIELAYLPWSFIFGSLITLLSCLATFWLWWVEPALMTSTGR